MFDMLGSQKTSSRQEITDYLGQSAGEGGFSSLADDVKNRLIDAATELSGMEQSQMLKQLREMTTSSQQSLISQLLGGQGPEKLADQGDTKHYKVKAGDSLYKISRAYNIGLKTLIEANPQIKNPDLIHPGQTIHIP